MSTTTTHVYLTVPSNVNLSQFTDVQRGTIFMWFISVLVIMIITGIRLISGQLDPEGAAYQQGKANESKDKGTSIQSFDKVVLKNNITTQEDSGSVKMMKKFTKFSTVLLPMTITFALGFVLGATYAFSLVLYFLILIPLIMFNMMEFHKWVFDHKVFICVFDNIWIVATFFWLINIWVTKTYEQPYYITQI